MSRKREGVLFQGCPLPSITVVQSCMSDKSHLDLRTEGSTDTDSATFLKTESRSLLWSHDLVGLVAKSKSSTQWTPVLS